MYATAFERDSIEGRPATGDGLRRVHLGMIDAVLAGEGSDRVAALAARELDGPVAIVLPRRAATSVGSSMRAGTSATACSARRSMRPTASSAKSRSRRVTSGWARCSCSAASTALLEEAVVGVGALLGLGELALGDLAVAQLRGALEVGLALGALGVAMGGSAFFRRQPSGHDLRAAVSCSEKTQLSWVMARAVSAARRRGAQPNTKSLGSSDWPRHERAASASASASEGWFDFRGKIV